MRQDREPQYLETGAIYVMRVAGFKTARHRFFGKTAFHEVPKERCFEIDDPPDLIIAEALLRADRRDERLDALPPVIGALILDFDGVFTDNRVIVNQDGVESVACDRSDGWGLGRLKRLGLPLLVLSTEKNPVVRARCDKLGLTCLHGVDDKWRTLQAWLAEKGIDPKTAGVRRQRRQRPGMPSRRGDRRDSRRRLPPSQVGGANRPGRFGRSRSGS